MSEQPDSTGPVANGRSCNSYRIRYRKRFGPNGVRYEYVSSLAGILEYGNYGLDIYEIRPCRIDLCSKALIVKDVLRAAAEGQETESRQQEITRLERRLNELTSNQDGPISTDTHINEREQQHYE